MIINTPKKPKTIADHLLQPTSSFKNTAAENARANGTHCNTAVALASFMLIKAVRKKIALFCNVRIEHVFQACDVDSIYKKKVCL